jgi:DNA phosphorothioation-dependent restriction protein DptH
MRSPVTNEQRQLVYEMLDRGESRSNIAAIAGLSPGQISAIAAHRTMKRKNQKAQASDSIEHQSHAPAEFHNARKDNATAIPLGVEGHTAAIVSWDLARASNPHMLIVGESGSGKTYTVSRLVIELANRHLPSIIFDYGQGFALPSNRDALGEKINLKELDLGKNGISVNPMQIFPTDVLGPVAVAQRIADTFLRVYPKLGVQQHSLLRKAALEAFHDSGITVEDARTWTNTPPPFKDIEQKILEYMKSDSAMERRAASTLSSHISTLFFFNTFRRSGLSLLWSDLIEHGNQLWILKLGALEESVERAVTEFLLWNLIRFAESLGPGNLRCFVILDEAHRLAMTDGSPVQRILREGRKFGIGVILASQQPEDFNSVAYTNTATKLAFHLFDDSGRVVKQLRRRAQEGMSVEQLAKTMSSLPRGSAYVVSSDGGAVVRLFSNEEAQAYRASIGQRMSE